MLDALYEYCHTYFVKKVPAYYENWGCTGIKSNGCLSKPRLTLQLMLWLVIIRGASGGFREENIYFLSLSLNQEGYKWILAKSMHTTMFSTQSQNVQMFLLSNANMISLYDM